MIGPDLIFTKEYHNGKFKYKSKDFELYRDSDGWRYRFTIGVFSATLQGQGIAKSIHFWKTKKGLIGALKRLPGYYGVEVTDGDGRTSYEGYQYISGEWVDVIPF